MEIHDFDVIVIGAGHAGLEAAAGSARRGAKTVMFTTNYDNIGQMSCNPAVGGLAKGQIAVEVDALGGLMGQLTDEAGIQFRTLNRSKGPAVQAPRAQCDRALYRKAAKRHIESYDGLTVKQDRVDEVLTKNGEISGVKTQSGTAYYADAVVVCTGTFLRGKIHLGDINQTGGRSGEAATTKLAESMDRFGLEKGRLKTGTPPRIDGSTVDYEQFEKQPGEEPPPRFSFFGEKEPRNIKPCWHSNTNEETHKIIRNNLDRSPIYGTGVIEGTGVRYCPSVEDKVVKFEQNDSHPIILEPEGIETVELYVNGLSTSLPPEIQYEMVKSIPGLEEAEITRWGYAIEYDFYQPTQLNATLETRAVPGLYFAGQINGTTGYEEAAGQGLVAGANAASRVLETDAFTLDRTQAYIGVLIDDLVTQGTREPYRMFTSRAEHRLCLRCDNAHYRLTPYGREHGLISNTLWDRFKEESNTKQEFLTKTKSTRIKPNGEDHADLEEALDESIPLKQTETIYDLCRRPEVTVKDTIEAGLLEPPQRARIGRHVSIEAKYEGYIKRQEAKIQKARRMESKTIPETFDYSSVPELSNESKEKLDRIRPDTLGQASRISGIKPTDIQVLMVYLEQTKTEQAKPA